MLGDTILSKNNDFAEREFTLKGERIFIRSLSPADATRLIVLQLNVEQGKVPMKAMDNPSVFCAVKACFDGDGKHVFAAKHAEDISRSNLMKDLQAIAVVVSELTGIGDDEEDDQKKAV